MTSNTNKQINSRILSYDLLRVFLTITVILIHTTSISVIDNEISFIINQLCRMAIPGFIILSGLSLSKSYENFDVKKFYLNRLKMIVVPYLLWSLIYYIYSFRFDYDLIFFSWSEFFKVIVIGQDHLYFIPIILQLYIALPVLRLVEKKTNKKFVIFSSFIIFIYFQVATYLTKWYIYILPLNVLKYSYLLLPSWLFYFLLGIYIDNNKLVNFSKLKLTISSIIAFILLYVDSKLTNTYGSSIKPTVVIYACSSIFLLLKLFSECDNTEVKVKVSNWLAKQSFFVYFIHIIIMNYGIEFMTYVSNPLSIYHIEGIICVSLFTIVSSFLLAFIAQHFSLFSSLGVRVKRVTK